MASLSDLERQCLQVIVELWHQHEGQRSVWLVPIRARVRGPNGERVPESAIMAACKKLEAFRLVALRKYDNNIHAEPTGEGLLYLESRMNLAQPGAIQATLQIDRETIALLCEQMAPLVESSRDIHDALVLIAQELRHPAATSAERWQLALSSLLAAKETAPTVIQRVLLPLLQQLQG